MLCAGMIYLTGRCFKNGSGLAVVVGIPVTASEGRIAPNKFGDVRITGSVVIFDKAEQRQHFLFLEQRRERRANVEASQFISNRLRLKTMDIVPRRFLAGADDDFPDLLFGARSCDQRPIVGFFCSWLQTHSDPIDYRRSLPAISEMKSGDNQRSRLFEVWLFGHQERPITTQCEFRSFGSSERGISGNLRLLQCINGESRLASSSIQQTKRNQRVNKSDGEDSPIGDRGPLIPFLSGLLLFCSGSWLNYLNWRWLNDDRERRRGFVGFVLTAGMMGAGLVLMFFVSAAYASGA